CSLSHVFSDLPEPCHVSSVLSEPRHVSCDTLRSRTIMMASVFDPPLMSVRAAGIPVASAPSSPIIKEILPPAAALPLMAVAILCMWAAHSAPEVSSVHESASVSPEVAAPAAEPPKGATCTTIESPEVAVYAAEPLEVAVSAAVSSVAVMPTAVSPEVAAEAVEPHKMGT
ncbi:hypothetical protein M9458_033967, partial [Cirrhinus mrigala]